MRLDYFTIKQAISQHFLRKNKIFFQKNLKDFLFYCIFIISKHKKEGFLMNKYSVIGFVLLFLGTIFLCTDFLNDALWVNYFWKSASESVFINIVTVGIYVIMFVLGIFFVRKGKNK